MRSNIRGQMHSQKLSRDYLKEKKESRRSDFAGGNVQKVNLANFSWLSLIPQSNRPVHSGLTG